MNAGRRRFLLLTGAALAMPRLARAAPPSRLLVFGDSLTAGYGLAAGDGLVPRLQAWLNDHDTAATVLDGGLSGDSTYGGRARIAWSLRRHQPDAVIVELGGNDMLLGWQADTAEANLDAILQSAGAGDRPVLLVGIQPPPSDNEDWRQSWITMWPRLAERHGALLLPDLYAPLMAQPEDQRDDLFLADRIHPSAAGVQLMVGALGPMVQQLLAQLPAER